MKANMDHRATNQDFRGSKQGKTMNIQELNAMDKAWEKLCPSAKRQAKGKVGFDTGWTLAWHHFQEVIREGKPALKRWQASASNCTQQGGNQ